MEPESFRVVPAARVNVPPTALRLVVNAAISNVPPETVKLLLMVRLPFGEAIPLALLIVRLLKVDASMVCVPVPLNITVPELAVNVPILTQLPPTEIVEIFPFNVVPKLIVTFPVTESNALTFTLALVERVRLLLTVVAEEMDAMPAVLSTVRL